MQYTVAFTTSARRDLANLDGLTKSRVSEALDRLTQTPRPHDCIKLVGQRDHYRVRVGAYRIVYLVDDRMRSVLVDRIQHRREVYR